MNTKIQLADHQKQMVKAAKKESKGRFQAPTGVGKTFAQAEILRLQLKDGFSVSIIKSPRISLSNQLANEYSEFISNQSPKLKWEKFLVHSGESLDFEVDDEASFEDQLEAMQQLESSGIDSTTSPIAIREKVLQARKLNIPIVIFTTYHSNIKVSDTLKNMRVSIALDINDEAHYLVREDFSDILSAYNPKRQYFFTATEKHGESIDGKGMNNESRFGKKLFNLSVAEAVKLKLILPVNPLLIKCHDVIDQDSLDENVGDIVMEAYSNLLTHYTNIGSKLLVATRGSRHIRMFLDSTEFLTLISQGVHILTVHSTKDLTTYNGEVISRKEFDKLKLKIGKDLNQNMIIVHYDILSEGIDIPGLLGVLILRKMGEAKFFQTVGRSLRVLRSNPSLKKFGFVMFPDICDADMTECFAQLIWSMQELGYTSTEKIAESSIAPNGEEFDKDDNDFTEESSFGSLSSALNLRMYTQSLDLSTYSL
jgi:superfamily II DNA or RNA helicase